VRIDKARAAKGSATYARERSHRQQKKAGSDPHTDTQKQRKDQKQELELQGRTCFAALNIGHEIDRKNNTRKVHRDKLKMRGVMAMGEDQIQARNGNSICHTLR
jgi:hypothetical protein